MLMPMMTMREGDWMRRALKGFMLGCTVVYLFALLTLLFGGGRGLWRHWPWDDYLAASCNLIPLETIGNYIKALIHHRIAPDIALKNLLGNLVIFLPMGLVLPCLFRRWRRPLVFGVGMLLMLFCVEGLQLLTKLGSFDVDDILLNGIGAWAGWAMARWHWIRRWFWTEGTDSGREQAASLDEAKQPDRCTIKRRL